jgi:hypothetical protein
MPQSGHSGVLRLTKLTKLSTFLDRQNFFAFGLCELS